MNLFAAHPETVRLIAFLSLLGLFALLEHRLPRRPLTVAKGRRWLANLLIVAVDSLAVRLAVPVVPFAMAALAAERASLLRGGEAAQAVRTGVDRDTQALDAARAWGETVWADIEVDPWPFEERRFGAVVVTHYLWRLLLPTILDSVEAGGVLIYETFAQGNETVGRPSRPDFLLRPGELLGLCSGPGWRVVAYEDGFLPEPERFVQRIAAVRLGDGATDSPQRFPLSDACR